jgi:hypothetical protein
VWLTRIAKVRTWDRKLRIRSFAITKKARLTPSASGAKLIPSPQHLAFLGRLGNTKLSFSGMPATSDMDVGGWANHDFPGNNADKSPININKHHINFNRIQVVT